MKLKIEIKEIKPIFATCFIILFSFQSAISQENNQLKDKVLTPYEKDSIWFSKLIGEYSGGILVPTSTQNTFGNQTIFGAAIYYPFNKNRIFTKVDVFGYFTAPKGNYYISHKDTVIERRITGLMIKAGYGRQIMQLNKISIDLECGIGYGELLNPSFIINPGLLIEYDLPLSWIRLRCEYYISQFNSNEINEINFSGNYFALRLGFTFSGKK